MTYKEAEVLIRVMITQQNRINFKTRKMNTEKPKTALQNSINYSNLNVF
jgi:hypothetical protein